MPNRRDFIKSVVGASAGVVFVGCELCDAMAAGRPAQVGSGTKHKPAMVGKRRVKTVDIHCHVSVPEATDLLKGTKIERRLGAGIALGGIVAQWLGWRMAFWIVGTPGLLLIATINMARPVSSC